MVDLERLHCTMRNFRAWQRYLLCKVCSKEHRMSYGKAVAGPMKLFRLLCH